MSNKNPADQLPPDELTEPLRDGGLLGEDDDLDAASVRAVSEVPLVETSASAGNLLALQKEIDEAWSQVARLRGEVSHRVGEYKQLRARADREAEGMRESIVGEVTSEFFEVIDDFERTLVVARESAAESPLARGAELVLHRFLKALGNVGVERIDRTDVEFDPLVHEAAHSTPGDVSEATVSDVVRAGYRTQSKVLRPALVNVVVPAAD